MASFGRKPARGGIGASSAGRASGSQRDEARSESFRKLQEEEEERERFAKEYEEQQAREQESSRRAADLEKRDRDLTHKIKKDREGRPNPKVFMDIEIRTHQGVAASGRMVFELYADVVPLTAENFRCLCTGEKGRKLHFQNTIFHRIIPGFMAQGGDITNEDGTGGMSIYGPRFKDEGFERRHERPGLLSMANSGKDSNNSQFFILFKKAPWLDSKHVVFGHLLQEEHQIMKKMEQCGSASGDVKGTVVMKDCGEYSEREAATRPRSWSRSRTPERRKRDRICTA